MTGITYSVDHYEEYKETKNKNLFEEVIDQLMIDELSKDIQEKIKNLPISDKRTAILAFLDKDRNLFMNIRKEVMSKKLTKMEHLKKVILMLREYVKVGEVEKKKFGEVMTPLELVKEMLATLPKEVWSNPDLKWLDPANGTGTYPLMVVYKLMIGLKDWEPDEEKRYKHIVENMIYVCEIQPKNMFLYMFLLDPFDEYLLNIYTGSFLEEGFDRHMKEVWELDKVNIVVGNPPFNTGAGGNGARDLWDKFVIKSISNINKFGYLIFVHPSKWRKSEHKILTIFKKYNLRFLEIHSDSDGLKTFNANTRYDFYCLQKSEYVGNTIIIDELGEKNNINIKEWEFIPNYNFDIIKSIISYKNVCDVIYNSSIYDGRRDWMSPEKSENNNLPCVYGMYKDYSCSYRYSSENKGHFGVSKVILGLGRHLYPMIDIDGEYGIMNNAFGIGVDSLEEAENIKTAIETDEFKEIIKSTKWSNFQVDYKMFRSFKKDFWKEFI